MRRSLPSATVDSMFMRRRVARSTAQTQQICCICRENDKVLPRRRPPYTVAFRGWFACGAATRGSRKRRAPGVASRAVSDKPQAYITGRQHFMGIELLAEPGALVPRAETELLGATAVRILREEQQMTA